MLHYLKRCLNSPFNRSRKLLLNLNLCGDFGTWKGRKTKKLVSFDLTSLTSSFAATEISSQLQQVFKFMDTNGDGKISPLELKQVVLSLGDENSMAPKWTAMEMHGFLSLDESMRVMQNSRENGDYGFCVEIVLWRFFRVYDDANNGSISASEKY